MSSIFDQGKEVWNRLPIGGRITTIGAALATIGLIFAVVYYGSQGEYGVLFSDLKPADAQTIVEKLKAQNVPYTLSNGGSTVLVPNERISELRLQMASSGALSGGHVGFDLFDKNSFGATDFAQRINFRRALEGELARTLEGMDEIENVRVHMTPKKESVFTEKEEGAKASVMLRVRQGKELSSERTDAIVNLVASAIQGLDPSGVSVMDTKGRLLTAAKNRKGESDSSVFNAHLDSKRKFESETAARIITLLEPITGEGRVRADVSAEIDFSKTEETEEKYNPQSQVIRSQKSSDEKRNSSTAAPRPAVGARSNDPTTPIATAQNKQKTDTDQRVATTTNYEIDKTTKRTINGGGQIKRLTVSVLVDHKLAKDVAVARTTEELSQIEKLVAGAVGTDSNRGDSVVVQTMPFNKENLGLEAPSASILQENKQLISTGIKYGLLALVAVLVLFFVIRPARKALKAASANAKTRLIGGAAGQLGSGAERRLGGELGTAMPALGSSTTVAELEAKLNQTNTDPNNPANTPDAQLNTVKKMLMDQTPDESDVVVGTLRGWMHESGDLEKTT